MTDVMEREVSVDEFEGELPEVRFVGSGYFGFSGVNGALVPPDGRFGHAYYSARVELSREPFEDETEVSDDGAVVVGRFECVALSAETWFEIETDRFEWTGEHTRDREDVPEWAAEEGAEGYIRVELTFEPDRTVEETSWSSEDLDRKRERCREEYFA